MRLPADPMPRSLIYALEASDRSEYESLRASCVHSAWQWWKVRCICWGS
jgi:hypothetical protein